MEHEFKFTNYTGKDVVIMNAQTACSCTVASWTKDPVEDGRTGVVKLSYCTRGRPGHFNKPVFVTFNNMYERVLRVSGNVAIENAPNPK